MRAAVAIALAAAAVGCGAGNGSSAPATTAAATTRLTISYWPGGKNEPGKRVWTLRCAPAGGTLPRAAAACRQLGTMARPFAPPAKGLVCTEQYGGPQVAEIVGLYRGARVWAQLRNRNGCEIARFKRLAFLVPAYGSGAGS